MKRTVLFWCLVLSPHLVLGQGTIQFANLVLGVVDYPISDCFGPLSGPGWTAQLWGARFGTSEEDLKPLLPTTTFLTVAPGYVSPVLVMAPELGPAAAIQIRVWDNEGGKIINFAGANVRAVSPIFQVHPGGWGLPPTLPANLDQLGEVPLLCVPSPGCEPPTNQCCFAIGFSRTNIVISESQKSVRISVSRNELVDSAGPAGPEQTVRFAFEDVTARLGQDYLAQAGTLSFTSPSSSWIQADILDNPLWSDSRTFRIRLFDPGDSVVLGRYSVATVTINDDDTVLGPRRVIDGSIRALVAAPGNKWFIGGDFTNVDGFYRGRISRVELDGAIDPTFDPGSGANGSVYSIVRQSNGMVVVGGAFTSFAGIERGFVVRLTESGSLDPAFNSAIAPANPGSGADSSVVRQVLLQADGRILVIGEGLMHGDVLSAGVLRLLADGTTDPSFLPPATLTNATVVALQSDGSVLVGADNGFAEGSLIRLNPNGSYDPTFNAALREIASRAVRSLSALAVLPNDQVLVGGMAHFSENDLGLLLLEPNGRPATQQIPLEIEGRSVLDGFIGSMTWQSKEKILIGGVLGVSSGLSTATGRAVVRLNSNLTQDLTFSSASFGWEMAPLAIQPDEGIGGAYLVNPNSYLRMLRAGGEFVQDLHFAGIARLPDGQFHLALRGVAPTLYPAYLQVSPDLANWRTVTPSSSELLGRAFKEVVATNESQRFYRVVGSP